jgi:hypothetical protein
MGGLGKMMRAIMAMGHGEGVDGHHIQFHEDRLAVGTGPHFPKLPPNGALCGNSAASSVTH